MSTLALIHTVHTILPEMEALCAKLLPGVRTQHLLDESCLRDAMRRGRLDSDLLQRVTALVILAERGGADAALVTCSSIAPCAEVAQRYVSIPVRRVDGPMAQAAVRCAGRIAVAATVASTLDPTRSLIETMARARGRRLRIETALFAEAFQARAAGRMTEHDRILKEGLLALAGRCSTLVLAQASMARVADQLDLPRAVRVLSSPASGVAQMRRLLMRV